MAESFQATPEEISHYEDVLRKSKAVLGAIKLKPFNQKIYHDAQKALKDASDRMQNPHIGQGMPLHGIVEMFDKISIRGVLSQLEAQIKAAQEKLAKMKKEGMDSSGISEVRQKSS